VEREPSGQKERQIGQFTLAGSGKYPDTGIYFGYRSGFHLGVAAGHEHRGLGMLFQKQPDQAAGLLFSLAGNGTGIDDVEGQYTYR